MADQTNQNTGPGSGDEANMAELKKKIEEAKKKEDEASVQDARSQEIETLKNQKIDAEAKALRALADLQNARKRMEDEKATFTAFATQTLIMHLLDIYDNYHRLMEHRPADLPKDEWHKGLELIDQQFQKFLEIQGVTRIQVNIGDLIDPVKHEAVMSGEGEEGKVLEIFSHGYEMRGRVIRPAKVKVGKIFT